MTRPAVTPPRFGEKIMGFVLADDERYEKLGDFEEGFRARIQSRGPMRARIWYSRQVTRYIPLFIKNSLYWSASMLISYLKIALRNIKKHFGYSFLNIAGLAAGLACALFILLWTQDEAGTNRFHAKIEALHIIRTIEHLGGKTDTGIGSVPALAPALKAEFPEVRNAARFMNGQYRYLLEYNQKPYREYAQMADAQIFEMFSFPLVRGSIGDVLKDPQAMVLSERTARRIFGGEDPIGKTIVVDKKDTFRVAGVMKDFPGNSTIKFDVWVPLEMTRKWWRPDAIDSWGNQAFRSYVELGAGTDVEAFNKKIFNRIRQARPDSNLEPQLYPFKDLYLKAGGREKNIRVFILIAFGILLIACINFMNLTTARSTRRAREVGLRKTVGAYRGQVMRQFFGESLFLVLLSLALAAGLVLILFPAFRALTGKTLSFGYFLSLPVLAGVFGVTLLTGLLSGIYPAVFLSGFQPANVLKGSRDSIAGGSAFRKVLVVFQFALSTILIIGTVVIYTQVRYMKNKDLGFDKEHLLSVSLDGGLLANVDAFKAELLRHPGIQSASATTHSPTGIFSNASGWDWPGRNPSLDPLVTLFGVDPDFEKTFGMELVQGGTFRKSSGDVSEVLINQCFAKMIGRPDVVGTLVSAGDTKLRVLGVVKDFHFMSVRREIEPLILYSDSTHKAVESYRHLFIRLNPGNGSADLDFIEKTALRFNPGFPFEYSFFDDDFDQLFRSVEREMSIVRIFAFLAILISALGLFGLAAFMAEQRTREIGIRKVLGATVPGLVSLLSFEYIRWVLLANMVAWPISYLFMKSWLKSYAYKISLGPLIFLGSAVLTFALAQMTVGFQAFKAARANPADAFRCE